jgi:hypothetical protein
LLGRPHRDSVLLGRDDSTHLDSLHLAIPVHALPVAACVDIAAFLVSFTIAAQSITTAIQACGGAIDVATITADDGLTFVRRKAADPVAVPDLSRAALLPICRTRPVLSIQTSGDPRRASSYTV